MKLLHDSFKWILKEKSHGGENMRVKGTETSFYANGMEQQDVNASNQKKQKKVNFFAGSFAENMQNNKAAKKRKEAQQKAMDIVGKAFKGEHELDNEIKDRNQKVKDLQEDNLECVNKLKEIQQQKDDLKKEYKIEDGSQEQKDLELLEKRRDSEDKDSRVFISAAEKKRLEQIDEKGYTEYQSKALSIESEYSYKNRIEENTSNITMENAIVRNTNNERLKSPVMVKAQNAADNVMDAASGEIKGMIMQDAKEHTDDLQEEAEKKAEEKKEKEEEKEMQLNAVKKKKLETEQMVAKAKENVAQNSATIDTNASDTTTTSKDETQEVLTDTLVKPEKDQDSVERELRELLNKMKLLEEDLKGASVDENL